MTLCAVLILLALVLPWLPLLWVYSSLSLPAAARFLPLDPDSPRLPEAFRGRLMGVQRSLYPLGFNLEACFLAAPPSRCLTFVAVLTHPRARDRAILTCRLTCPGRFWSARLLSWDLAFVSPLASGQTVVTHNSAVLTTPATATGNLALHRAGVRDAAGLYRVHTAVLAQGHPGMGRSSAAPPRADHLLAGLATASLYQLVGSRTLAFDELTGRYHPTVLGALRLAWLGLVPRVSARVGELGSAAACPAS